MGGLVSTNMGVGVFLMRCLGRTRRHRAGAREITISVNDIQVYTDSYDLDLTNQPVNSDEIFHGTLQTHPQPAHVRKMTLCGRNKITQIPVAIGHFENLETLILSNNHIEAISWAIVYLRELKVLDLSYNMLTEVPRVIGHLSRLEELNLQGNQLSRIPTELLNLTRLKKLDVSKNYKLFPSDKANISTDKKAIFEMLKKRLNRMDIWEDCTPWVSEHGFSMDRTKSVPSLHELCMKGVMKYKVDYLAPRFVPPVLKNNLSDVEHAYRNNLNLAKCSNCRSYFSTKENFDNHLC